MAKTVYPYISPKKGYHVGYAHDSQFDRPKCFEWRNSRGIVDMMSEDSPVYQTLSAVRKQAYNQLMQNDKIWSIDIVKYGSRQTVFKDRYIADYVGTVKKIRFTEIKWVDAEGKWYNLKKDGSLGAMVRPMHTKEYPKTFDVY